MLYAIILYTSGGTYSLKSTPSDRFLSFCQKSSERKSPKKYIIGHYNPSVWISDLASHHTHIVCINFIHEWRHLQFKVDSERQIFEFLPEILWKEVAEEIFSHISLSWRCLTWGLNRSLTSYKVTHNPLDHGDLFPNIHNKFPVNSEHILITVTRRSKTFKTARATSGPH